MKSLTTRPAWVQLADHLLGRDLADWLRERRTPAHPTHNPPGWRVLAAELADITDGQVTVTYDPLRRYWLSVEGVTDDDLDAGEADAS